MDFQLPSLSPRVSGIVVIDVAEQQAGVGAVDNQAHITRHPHGPKPLVSGLVELVELVARLRRLELKIERRRLNGLLLVAG
jgi:hypothetical protein